LDKDWLKECVKLMDSNKKIGICGSKLLYKSSKNKINSIGGTISRIGIGLDIAKGENDKFFDKNKILFACSAAILVRRNMLQKIGCFDNTFFYSYEDTDLGWRANLAGYDVIFNPKAIAYHNLNETIKHITEKVYFHSTKNRVRMLIKNYELHNLAIYLPILILVSLFDILFRKYKLAKFRGLVWNFLNIKDTLLERKNVQKHRNLKDKSLFSMFKKGWF
jgi:GT2 family glycosyltransferase